MSARPALDPLPPRLRARRLAFAALVIGSIVALVSILSSLFAADGLTWWEAVMLALFTATTPWLAIGFWNALIGFAVLHGTRAPLRMLFPVAEPDPARPITSRNALIFPIRNEPPASVFRRIKVMVASLDASALAGHFAVFVLSDTDDPAIALDEERLFAALCAEPALPGRFHYRRRAENTGFKAGNIRDFCERFGAGFENMLVCDADSLMSAAAITRLVRLMDANPGLGIVQTLISGLPATSPFARIFQFGMRHGMRVYTAGSVWWQGDAGPYWGHNAIIRIAPFVRHCALPVLPGGPPLGGLLLSHDQVEAVLMRRAGYAVRVLPVEVDSFEDNPTTLPDFLKRDLRWCQGNLQYLKLLTLPGLHALGRLQLLLAILMYTASPLWLGFIVTGLGQLAVTAVPASVTADQPAPAAPAGIDLGLALFATVMAMSFAPKMLGIVDVLLRPAARRAYGGAGLLLAGALVETLFSLLLAPVVAVAHSIFIAGLGFGRTIHWDPQRRHDRAISVAEALRGLWPQLALGVAALLLIAAKAPALLSWASPLLAGWLLAVPFACATSSAALGRVLARTRLCASPETLRPPPEVAAAAGPRAIASGGEG